MWKAHAGQTAPAKPAASGGDDEWETDPDFVNDVSEKEQRWGAKTVKGSVNLENLRQGVLVDHAEEKKKQLETGPKASFGYGGKFGVQKDRMDEVAMGHDYVATTEKHSSQKDYSHGFGGKYGVMKDRVDKSAMGYEHVEQVGKHSSQTDYSHGFGGKYGVDAKQADQSAVGFDHKETVGKHSSQTDYSKGFGGKYGVERDRVDKSAVGFQHVEQVDKHPSQKDYAVGFGGKFGVQGDRQDASARGFDEPSKEHSAGKSEEGTRHGTGLAKGQAKLLREKFEAGPPAPAFQAPAPKAKVSLPTTGKAPPVEAPPEESLPRRELAPAVHSAVAACPDESWEQHETDKSGLAIAPEADPSDASYNVYEEVGDGRNDEPLYEDLPLTATALYDYDAVDQDEISFQPGDVITDIEQVDEGWWRGSCHGHIGLFPSNYVQLNS